MREESSVTRVESSANGSREAETPKGWKGSIQGCICWKRGGWVFPNLVSVDWPLSLLISQFLVRLRSTKYQIYLGCRGLGQSTRLTWLPLGWRGSLPRTDSHPPSPLWIRPVVADNTARTIVGPRSPPDHGRRARQIHQPLVTTRSNSQ